MNAQNITVTTIKITEEQKKRLDNNFTYHKPFGSLPIKYEVIRDLSKELAATFCMLVPESRELSLALTKLEEAVMWANAGIARNEKPPEFSEDESKIDPPADAEKEQQNG